MTAAPAIRSLLFVPGDSESKILKAVGSAADAVIIDLEDAVAPERKAAARALSAELLGGMDRRGKPIFVRANAFDTGMTAADVASVMGGRPWGIVLPKCAGPAEIGRLSHYLDALEAREGIEVGSTRILTVATETAAATLNLSHLQGDAAPRLWGLLWGGEDLSATLGAMANRDESGSYTFPYQFARTQCLYAAHALGVQPVDAVYTNFRDPEGLERETAAGLRDGFTAKAAIHPAQAEVINRALTPTQEQLAWAREVVTLLADAGVARVNGRMVDIAHKRVAERILARSGLAAAPR
jgi:citrate lyase subunit beta / citryl-CoA lyase